MPDPQPPSQTTRMPIGASSAASSANPSPPSASRTSVPPSEPRPSRASLSAIDAEIDRPARLQLVVALVLGLVLVAIPLYLWRRPRAESIVVTVSQDAGAAAVEAPPPPPDEKAHVSEPRATCHDPGPKKTPPERCDHLADVEKALAKAVEETASCVPKDAGDGTIVYQAEVTLGAKKRSVAVTTPKEGRSIKNPKVVSSCQAAVKAKIGAVGLEGLKHEHHRYRISVTATYPGAVKP